MVGERSNRLPGFSSQGIAQFLLLLAFSLAGCHKVTEYSSEGEIGVSIIRLSDFSVEGTVKGFEGGRAICSLGEEDFLVSSNRGRLFWGNSNDQTIENAYTIGTAFSSGYGSIAQGAGSVYVVAGYGQIVQFSLSSRSVIDEFNAGPLPSALCRSSFAQRIYVADGQDSMLREVWISDNEVHREIALSSPAVALASCLASDSLLIGVSGVESTAFRIYANASFSALPSGIGAPSSDVAAMPDTAIFCATHPVLYGEGGVTMVWGAPMTDRIEFLSLEGQAFRVCADPVYRHFYVASYLGGMTTRIYEIDALEGDIIDMIDIDGFPRDMTLHAGSEDLLVLTSE